MFKTGTDRRAPPQAGTARGRATRTRQVDMTMWFLIKGSVFFAAVLVVLSYFSSTPKTETEGVSALQVTDAVSAATEAYHYVSAICSEKPEVCEKGADTFAALGLRAREGAKVAFDLLDKQFGSKQSGTGDQSIAVKADPDPTPFPQQAALEAPVSDQVHTGTVPVPQKRPIR
jgi:hypothetical protein